MSRTGYCACESCTVDGDFVSDRVVFNDTNFPERFDESFRKQADVKHYEGTSILESLPNIDMVKCFPLEIIFLVFYVWLKKVS